MKNGTLIRAARKSRGWTLQRMSDELSLLGIEIDTGNLSRIETEKQGPSSEVLSGILKVFGISLEQQLSKAASLNEDSNVAPGPELQGVYPVISWVQAGNWSEVIDLHQPGFAEEWLPCPGKCGPNTYILKVVGESMYDPAGRKSFREGDLIFVDPDKQEENGSLVVVKLTDEQKATFKQLIIEDDQKYLKALNPSWPNRIMPINGNAVMCGVVIYKVEPM